TRGGAREEVVEREHRVRLAAPEVRLELHDRIAAAALEAAHGADEELLQAFGEVGAPEELDWVLVLVGAFPDVDLPEVGRELGLLVAAAGDVLVRAHDLAPGLELPRGLRLDGRRSGPALLRSHLLVKSDAQKLHLHLLDLLGL